MRIIALAAVMALAVGAVAARQAIPQATGANVARDLRGAIDIHVHADPDNVPRSLDGLEAARFAKDKGMRAIVLKSHFDPTAGLALARAQGRAGHRGVRRHRSQPAGRRHECARRRAHGAGQRRLGAHRLDVDVRRRESGQDRASRRTRRSCASRRTARCSPETKAVIAAIAKHNLVLASGHVSAQEALLMFEEGQRLGVRGMVATHGMSAPTSLTVEQAQQAARFGAFIEFVSGTLANASAQAEDRSYRRRYPQGRRRARDSVVRSRTGAAIRCRPMATPRTWKRCARKGSPIRNSIGWRSRIPRDCWDFNRRSHEACCCCVLFAIAAVAVGAAQVPSPKPPVFLYAAAGPELPTYDGQRRRRDAHEDDRA